MHRSRTGSGDYADPAAGSRSRSALSLALALLLSGCATTSPEYPYFDRLAIEALPPAPLEEGEAVATAGELAAAGAAAGGGGALAAGVFTSLLCGPFFAVCLAGTGAAALGGATVGAVLAGSTALSEEETGKVVGFMKDLQSRHNLSEELAAAVAAQLPAARLAEPGTGDARLGVEAQGLRAATGFNDTFALWVTAKANLDWDLNRPQPARASRRFACQTETLSLEDWLSEDGARASKALAVCIDDLAVQIQTALEEPATAPDAGSVGLGANDLATGNW